MPGGPGLDTASRARLAVAWATGFQLFRDLVQFGLTVALVRLLPAEVYGQFGFLTTLLGFFTLYSFREFLGHTLQVRGDAPVHYQDHFTAGAAVQAAIVLLINVAALGLRWLPDYAPVAGVLHVMSLLFVVDLPAEFRVRMLERELDWRRLRLLQAVGFSVGGVMSVALALAGAGIYALMLPMLVAPLPFVHDLLVRARWRPTWSFSWQRFHPAWAFGWTRIGTVSLVAVASVVESSWLAGVFGFALLGIFGRATGLAQLLCGRIAGLLSLSIYPVLTRLDREGDAFKRAGAMYLRSIGWVVVPLAALTALLASPIVRVIYGPAWVEAIPLVPLAVAAAAIAAIVQTAYTLLLASGRQRACLAADGWRLAGTLMALVAALPAGPLVYLASICALHAVSLGIVMTLLRHAGTLSGKAVWLALGPPVACATLGLAAARLVPGHAAVQAIVFAAVYGVTVRGLFATPFAELVRYLPQSRRLYRWLRFSPAATA
jgi:O-antigen/teichoic acid export membrane protein